MVMVVGFAGGACLSLLAPSERSARALTALGAVVGCVGGLVAAARVLATQVPVEAMLPNLVAAAGGFVIRLDVFGAFFLVLVAIASHEAASTAAATRAIVIILVATAAATASALIPAAAPIVVVVTRPASAEAAVVVVTRPAAEAAVVVASLRTITLFLPSAARRLRVTLGVAKPAALAVLPAAPAAPRGPGMTFGIA